VRNTALPGYNIITGGAALTTNRFEAFTARDARRTR